MVPTSSRLGAGQILPEEVDAIVQAVELLRGRDDVDPTRVGIVGFSVDEPWAPYPLTLWVVARQLVDPGPDTPARALLRMAESGRMLSYMSRDPAS